MEREEGDRLGLCSLLPFERDVLELSFVSEYLVGGFYKWFNGYPYSTPHRGVWRDRYPLYSIEDISIPREEVDLSFCWGFLCSWSILCFFSGGFSGGLSLCLCLLLGSYHSSLCLVCSLLCFEGGLSFASLLLC